MTSLTWLQSVTPAHAVALFQATCRDVSERIKVCMCVCVCQPTGDGAPGLIRLLTTGLFVIYFVELQRQTLICFLKFYLFIFFH